jgi:chaperone required for assembly of F1-ATPase
MKRFYKEVTIQHTPDGYAVLLDGRSVKTPSKKELVLPTHELAEALAQEWAQQGEHIDMPSMVLTRLSYGVLELNAADRAMLHEETVEYITTELLCYRDAQRPELWQQQVQQWDEVLEWAQREHAVVLTSTAGILPVEVAAETYLAVQQKVQGLDDWHLVPFALLVRVLGSFVLALAVLERYKDMAEAMRLAHLEADYQALQWGVDVDVQARRAAAMREVLAVEQMFAHLAAD